MPKRVPVHWVKAPEDQSFHMGRFPVNFWQIPSEKRLSSPRTYREFYALPVIDRTSQIKIAFHNELADCDPIRMSREILPEEVAKIRAIISQFFPGLHQRPITSEVCMYTMTPDGHFYLGKRPGLNHVFGVALAGHGFKFAPVLGEIVADLMTDIAPAVDIDIFSPDRFSTDKSINEK